MLKRSLYTVSGALGIHRAFARLNRGRPCVLAFHGVIADETASLCNHEGKHLHASIFERFMRHLESHYHPVPLRAIANWLEDGQPLPPGAVAITFDDGYRNVLDVAAPILGRLGIPATLFVVTDFVFEERMLWVDRIVGALSLTGETRLSLPHVADGGGEMSLATSDDRAAADVRLRAMAKSLDDTERVRFVDEIITRLGVEEGQLCTAWAGHDPVRPDELPRLIEAGITVGSHTCSHGIATRYPVEQLRRELGESKRRIEGATGRPCEEFSYPNGAPGDFDGDTGAAVAAAGYRLATTTVKRRLSAGDDRFAIPRYLLTHNRMSVSEFAAEVSGCPDFLRGVRERMSGRPTPPHERRRVQG